MIYWAKGKERRAMLEYAAIRDSDGEFERKAKMQANSKLASAGGYVAPFGRNTTGNKRVEDEAFKLQKDEISSLICSPDGCVVVKCVRHIPPDTQVSLESAAMREKL